MKELSIEEKAKAYDEAIERGSRLWESDTITRESYEYIFPELKESEDERIRKALMQNLKERFGTKGNMGKGLDMPDVLAWLEKHGEKKHKVEPIRDGLKTEFQKQVSHLIASTINNEYDYTLDHVEWVSQSLLGYAKNELKLVEWSEEDELMLTSLKDILKIFENRGGTNIKIEWLEELKERILSHAKQELSDWDKTIIESIEALCDEKIESVVYQDVKEHAKEIKDWLKNLKERVQPNPNQEWSEEDCNEIEIIACHLDNIGNRAMSESLLNIMDKYKSYRPQNTWKPSKAQIEAIEDAIEFLGCTEKVREDLKSLHEKLKKLREE